MGADRPGPDGHVGRYCGSFRWRGSLLLSFLEISEHALAFGHHFEHAGGLLIALPGSLREHLAGERNVDFDSSLAGGVGHAQHRDGTLIAAVHRLVQPPLCLRTVLWYALAQQIQCA
jgi:hypothetical protein